MAVKLQKCLPKSKSAVLWRAPPGVPASGADVIIADTTTNATVLDADRVIGKLAYGDDGTRQNPLFTINTDVHTLTIAGGLEAAGNLAGGDLVVVGGSVELDSPVFTGELGFTNGRLRLMRDFTGSFGYDQGALTLDTGATLTGDAVANLGRRCFCLARSSATSR